VGRTVITYRYRASLGVDLKKVELKRDGKQMTFLIPPLEVLADSIEPLEVTKNDFFSHAIDRSTESLLQEQLMKCREACLQEKEDSETAWENTQKAFRETIGEWLQAFGDASYTFAFEKKTE